MYLYGNLSTIGEKNCPKKFLPEMDIRQMYSWTQSYDFETL
jgi:hypothetical protein